MHILIAEKNLNGRRMLNQILKMEGYEVSIAESGSHALNLLQEARPDIVLMNVFKCMDPSDPGSAGKVSVRHYEEAPTQILLLTCGKGSEKLAEFMSPDNSYCNAAFDRLPARIKCNIMDRIQQMCSALKQSRRFAHPEEGFNWQRFSMLMDCGPTLAV